jgi:magnesium-transporting ATPase (P-type)
VRAVREHDRPPADAAAPLGLSAAARQPVAAVLEKLGSGQGGLTAAVAAERLPTFGPNAVHSRRVTAWGVLVRQLRNPLLILLLAAASVSGLTGDPTDANPKPTVSTTIAAMIASELAGTARIGARAECAAASIGSINGDRSAPGPHPTPQSVVRSSVDDREAPKEGACKSATSQTSA